MTRLVGSASRGLLALFVFGVVLALLRLGPVFAAAPIPVRVAPLALPAIASAAFAACFGASRARYPWRPVLAALAAAVLLLSLTAWLRGPLGLPAIATAADARLLLPPGPVDLIGEDLEPLPRARRVRVRWEGELRAPISGPYRLWVSGRGRVEVRIDGRLALAADGERLDDGADALIGAGRHPIEIEYRRVGPGPRLRLGWTPPGSRFVGPGSEMIPPRALGVESRAWPIIDALALLVAALSGALAWMAPWDAPRALPAPRPVTPRQLAMATLAYLATFAFMSWPLLRDPARLAPLHQPDGRLNAWILAWDVHALGSRPSEVFQAPIFHPLPDALAFSENLLLPAILTAPAQLLSGPALAFNMAFTLGLVFSGIGVMLLVRRVTGDGLAAFVGGAIFAFGIHRSVNVAHLHAQFTPFLPLALLALDRFFERPSVIRGALVGLCIAFQGLSSVYLGAITASLVAVALAVAALAGRLDGRALRGLAAGALLATALLAPLVRPYLRMRAHQGEEFTLATVSSYATTPESYLASASPFYESQARRHLDPERIHDPLFPGLIPLLLGLGGLAVAPRRYRVIAIAGTAVAVLISLGPATAFYRVLHENIVLFRGIRALSRFAIVPVLALSVLSGIALAGRGSWRLVALLLALGEAYLPPRLVPLEPPSALAELVAVRGGVAAFLPLGEHDTETMLANARAFPRLVNGDSGFMPRPYARAMEALNAGLDDDALRLLRALGVRSVVGALDERLPVVARFGERAVHAVPDGEIARPPAAASLAPTLWSRAGAVVDIGEERRVSRIVFEIGEGDWCAAPRVELSSDGKSWALASAHARLSDATIALYRDPRHGLGEVRFEPQAARFVRLDSRIPSRRSPLGVGLE